MSLRHKNCLAFKKCLVCSTHTASNASTLSLLNWERTMLTCFSHTSHTLLKHFGGLSMDKKSWARKLKQYRGGKENIFKNILLLFIFKLHFYCLRISYIHILNVFHQMLTPNPSSPTDPHPQIAFSFRLHLLCFSVHWINTVVARVCAETIS